MNQNPREYISNITTQEIYIFFLIYLRIETSMQFIEDDEFIKLVPFKKLIQQYYRTKFLQKVYSQQGKFVTSCYYNSLYASLTKYLPFLPSTHINLSSLSDKNTIIPKSISKNLFLSQSIKGILAKSFHITFLENIHIVETKSTR